MTRRSERRIDAAALVALAALTLVFFWKIALTNRVLAGLDVFAYFYPYRDFASEALRAGRLPLWNPYLFMGAPLLANSQAAVLYPLHWPLIWLSTPKQIAWSIVLHIWLAGAGTYLFARRVVRLRPPAALVAASRLCPGWLSRRPGGARQPAQRLGLAALAAALPGGSAGPGAAALASPARRRGGRRPDAAGRPHAGGLHRALWSSGLCLLRA